MRFILRRYPISLPYFTLACPNNYWSINQHMPTFQNNILVPILIFKRYPLKQVVKTFFEGDASFCGFSTGST